MTKERILSGAEEIILSKSFHSVGLNEILAEVKVPKGSFYHYFPSKEQFGVELIAHYVAEHTAYLQTVFGPAQRNALEKFVVHWRSLIGRMDKGKCQECCLVVKLGLEVSNFSEPMRAALAKGMQSWRKIFEQAVREGQADQSIRKQIKASEAATLIQDTWQGAMQRMLVERSVAPLRAAAKFLRTYLSQNPTDR